MKKRRRKHRNGIIQITYLKRATYYEHRHYHYTYTRRTKNKFLARNLNKA